MGIKFRSGFEKQIWEKANELSDDIEYEPSDKHLDYNVPARYIPDFVIGDRIFIESKGYFGPRDRAKMRRVKASNPKRDIRFVFQRANNRISKSKNSMMYWQWAEKHGFEWAEGSIPEEWFNETNTSTEK